MKKTLVMASAVCICFNLSHAQNVRMPIAASSHQWQAFSRYQHQVFSGLANQASLVHLKNPAAGIYGERKFLLADLGHYLAAVAFPLDEGKLGLTAAYLGNSSYNESQLGLAYARSWGSLDVGIQFNYFHFSTAGYAASSAINVEAGLILQLADEIRTGLHLYNPSGSRYGKSKDERLPLVFTAGIGYDASENIFLAGVIQKLEDHPVNIHAGVVYRFNKLLWARAGISTAAPLFLMGAGLQLNDFQLELNVAYHPQLGPTPGMMLLYQQKAP